MKSKTVTITGILIALSVLWTTFMYTVDLGIWSFTPFSHLFIFIGMYLTPVSGILVAVGTFIGFLIKSAAPVVLMRAGSHILFVLVGALLLRRVNINKPFGMFLFLLVTAIVHAAAETACVYLAIGINIPLDPSKTSILYIWGATFGMTIIHSCADAVAAYFLSKLLSKNRIAHFGELEKSIGIHKTADEK